MGKINQRDLISNLLEENPKYKQRKYRYEVISRLSKVEPETCQLICSLADEYRHQTEADTTGIEMSNEWSKPIWMRKIENEIIQKEKQGCLNI